jgi:hypothetical protein
MIRRCCTGLPKFPYLAPYNAMMVKVQKPGSAFVATLDTWQKVYHRRPKPGARPLVILRRFGPISFVYELDDTEGKKMPQEVISKYILHPFHSDTLIDEAKLQTLISSLLKEGIRYREENYGTYYGGQIQWNATNVARLSHTTNGFTKKAPKTPPREIRLAQERRAEYIRRMEGLK